MFIQEWSGAVRDKVGMKFIGLLRRSLKKRSIFQTLIYIALEWLYHRLGLEYFH